ncbi:MAG: S8 family serine peptidase [Myxococcaceae bacterium]
MTVKLAPATHAGLAAGTAQKVIVVFSPPPMADEATADFTTVLRDRAEVFQSVKDRVLRAAPALTVVREYDQLPLSVVSLSSEQNLTDLLADPNVAGVYDDEVYQHTLAQSLPLIGQPTAAANGFTGAGTTVAVLDTGLDYTLSDFGHCTAPGTPSGCRVPYVHDFAPDDGVLDANGHGTNVAAIVAGVAPGASVLGLDVFSGSSAYSSDIIAAINWCIQNRATYNIVALNMSLGSGGSTTTCGSDVFASAISSAKQVGILSAVASGNNGYSNMISSPACTPDAVSVGAVYDATMSGLSYSNCSDASPVADQITCFSNSASFLSLLAPGAMITAGGHTMAGTSQASPHVAGAIAVLRAGFPSDTPDQTVNRLKSTGKSITDARNGVTTPRIDLAAATSQACTTMLGTLGTLSSSGGTTAVSLTTGSSCAWSASASASWLTVSAASGTGSATLSLTASANTGAARATTLTVGSKTVTVSQAADTTGPVGTVSVTSGSPTRSLTATLALSATDPAGVAQMCISNSATCTAWQTFASTASWTLASGGSGNRTVYVRFKDALGNASASAATAQVAYDITAPTQGTIASTLSDKQVELHWSGFTDAVSGVASYTLVYATGTAPASCTAGTSLYSGTATTFTQTGLTNGTTYGYRLCATDGAGNTSVGVTATARPVPEQAPPVGSVTIDSGDSYTRATAATLTLSATDASGVAQMCVSNSASCTAWETYATSKSWTLTAGSSGTRTVFVSFRDVWGNTSTAVSDTIVYDVTVPTAGTLTGTGGNAQVSLSWSGVTDPVSGVASYTVVFGTASAPASCSAGTVAYSGTATSFVHTGLSNGNTYYYRLCATDRAGNTSAGVTANARPAPEYAAPTGTIQIGNGAAYVSSLTTTLTLASLDASAVPVMCVSNTTSCTAWIPSSPTLSWTMAAGSSGNRSVYVWFRDEWGNTMTTPAHATVYYDVTAPSGGALTATAGTASVALSWTGVVDAGVGLDHYVLVFAVGTAPVSCAAGTVLQSGTSTTFSHTGLTSGTTYGYRLCGVDKLGNVSTGLTKTAKAN